VKEHSSRQEGRGERRWYEGMKEQKDKEERGKQKRSWG
jgi:hypothetical protein